MKKILCLLATVAALGVARAADENFTITLDTAQVVGPNKTPARAGSGDGVMVLKDNNTLTYTINYTGLPEARKGVVIYGPAPAGSTAGALYVITSPSETGTGNGTLQGTISLVAGRGGYSLAQQRSQLLLSQWYVGFSTATYPATSGDMDLRGQISYNVIPEPGTWSLLTLGLAGMALRLRKK